MMARPGESTNVCDHVVTGMVPRGVELGRADHPPIRNDRPAVQALSRPTFDVFDRHGVDLPRLVAGRILMETMGYPLVLQYAFY
jgi:hypothetical protein